MSEELGIPFVTEELIDCSGRLTHRLILDLDGTVTIAFASSGVTVRVDPATRQVVTPGVHVPPVLIDRAVSMRFG